MQYGYRPDPVATAPGTDSSWTLPASPDTVYSQNHIVLVKSSCCLNQG